MVIANAGVGSSGHASTLQWQDTARIIDVNVSGAFATLSAAIPIFLAQQRGHLVGVSSLAGKRGLPDVGGVLGEQGRAVDVPRDVAGRPARGGDHGHRRAAGLRRDAHQRERQPGEPFLWTADKAARVIATRLERAPAVLSFPWPLALTTSMLRYLPAWLYDRIARSVG